MNHFRVLFRVGWVGTFLFLGSACTNHTFVSPTVPGYNPTPSATTGSSLTATPTASSTTSPVVAATLTNTFTNVPTLSRTPPLTPVFTTTATNTSIPSLTPTRTLTGTFTPTLTWSATRTFTAIHTLTPTFTSTFTSTPTLTNTATPTATRTYTGTATVTPSGTWYTSTPTVTLAFTSTDTPANTPTVTWSPTVTATPSGTVCALSSYFDMFAGTNPASSGTTVYQALVLLYNCSNNRTLSSLTLALDPGMTSGNLATGGLQAVILIDGGLVIATMPYSNGVTFSGFTFSGVSTTLGYILSPAASGTMGMSVVGLTSTNPSLQYGGPDPNATPITPLTVILAPTLTPTATATITDSPSPIPTPTGTYFTPTLTSTPTPTNSPTRTYTPTATAT